MDNTPIASFRGDYEFLSNFYPCEIIMGFGPEQSTFIFQNAEAAFQAHKSPIYEDLSKFENITGAQAKKLGRNVNLREDWNDVKVDIMRHVVLEKFIQNPDLAVKLMGTGTRKLVEGNDWNDTFWGVCDGVGENHLGNILMEVRDMLFRLDKFARSKTD